MEILELKNTIVDLIFMRGVKQQTWSGRRKKNRELEHDSFEITESEEQKEKRIRKWRQPKGLIRHHQTDQYTYYGDPRRREKEQRTYLGKKFFFKSEERNGYTKSNNSNQDKFKNTHMETHYN